MQGNNGIFNCFRHCIYFALLGNILVTYNRVDSGFYSSEILVVVLVQGICLGNGRIYLSIISVLVLQGSNRIFDSLCHLVYFGLLSNVLATHDSLDSSFHTGKILVVIFLQSICLGNGFINLCVVSILVLQGNNGIFNRFRHCIYFALLGNVLVTHNGVDSGFYSSEILVVVLVQSIYLSNGFINLRVICRQISHCNVLRMSCCISRNRNIWFENLTIICIDFDGISTRFQINRGCYFLTIHFNNYIRQLGRCYDKRNRILRCRQKGRSIGIKSIIAASSSNLIKELLSFHIFKGLCCSSILVLKASRDIFSFNEIIVFKSRCIRRNTACNTT